MTWFKVDDGFWGHPKQTALPPGPVALWVRAGSWSGSQLTDGFVPAHMVVMLGAKKRDAEMLVIAGLWESVDDGYQFHDWAKWQPTRGEVEKKRAEDAERKAEWRRKKAALKAAEEAAATDVSQRDSDRTDAVTPRGVRSTRPDPTRPDPTRPDPDSPTESPSHVETSRGNATEVDAWRDPNEPPKCFNHRGMRRDFVPDCKPCEQKRKQWEAAVKVQAEFGGDPWCGDDTCHPITRRRETRFGSILCPECHPLAGEETA